MKPIKFRAWDRELKVMIQADDFFFSDKFEPFCDSVASAQEHYDIMQFTGLKDRHGKEIYEGDVVRFRGLRIVRFDEYRARFVLERLDGRPSTEFPLSIDDDGEILGNLYEQPELLSK